MNGDVIGWITVPGTDNNHPILQAHASDPDYYLHHDIREAHGVAHLGVWGLDEYSLMLRSEGFIAIPLDVAETGDRVPEGQAVSEDDGIRTLKALLLAFCVEIERTQGIVVPYC